MTTTWRTAAFEKWFGRSRFVADDGAPLVLFHGSADEIDAFDLARGIEGKAIHLGTLEQARMRTSRRSARIHPVVIAAERVARRRDPGTWTRRALAAAARQGLQAVVYLNRYEGIPSARIEALAAADRLGTLDRLSDAEFRKAVPEARDSLVLFDPCLAKSTFNVGTFLPGPHLTDDPKVASSVSWEEAAFVEDWFASSVPAASLVL